MAGELPLLVLQDIKEALEAIVTDDLSAGEVQLYRGRIPDVASVDCAFFMVRPESEVIDERWSGDGSGFDTWKMTVQVFGADKAPAAKEGDVGWPVQHAARLRDEIQAAVLDDIYRGGYAESTECIRVDWFPADLQEFDASVVVTFEVLITQQANDSTQG